MISTKVTAVLRRRWPILAISLVVGLLAGVVSSQLAPSDIVQQYRAEQVVVANASGTGGVSVQQDSLKVTRGEIPTIAAEALGDGERADKLAADMKVTVDTDSQSITIASVDVDPDLAARRVNEVTKRLGRDQRSASRSRTGSCAAVGRCCGSRRDGSGGI